MIYEGIKSMEYIQFNVHILKTNFDCKAKYLTTINIY